MVKRPKANKKAKVILWPFLMSCGKNTHFVESYNKY